MNGVQWAWLLGGSGVVFVAFMVGVFRMTRDINGPIPDPPEGTGWIKRAYWWVLGP